MPKSNTRSSPLTAGVGDALIELVRSRAKRPLTLRSFTAMMLLQRQGPMLVGDVADKLDLSKSTAWRMAESLAEMGLIGRTNLNVLNDERVRCVLSLSPEGASCVNVFTSRLQVAEPDTTNDN